MVLLLTPSAIGILKDIYKMQGGDTSNGTQWHNYMLRKCYVPYTDYHECRIDQREATFDKLRAQVGEEKHQESVEKAKQLLAQKVGDEAAEKIFVSFSNKSSVQRFKELRQAIDEERGVIRDGMQVPDIEKESGAGLESGSPVGAAKGKTHIVEEPKSKSRFRGWWSEPESRFKKGDESQS